MEYDFDGEFDDMIQNEISIKYDGKIACGWSSLKQ